MEIKSVMWDSTANNSQVYEFEVKHSDCRLGIHNHHALNSQIKKQASNTEYLSSCLPEHGLFMLSPYLTLAGQKDSNSPEHLWRGRI